MMGTSMLFLLIFSSFASGNGGDLLDFADTQAYWQVVGEEDYTINAMVGVLEDDDAFTPDRLMAIRTLGELGTPEQVDKDAILAVLEPLTESEAPFEAEYATRAIAMVNGEPLPARPRTTPQQAAHDLALLPGDCIMAAQWRLRNGPGPIDWNTMLPANAALNMPFDRDEMMQGISRAILEGVALYGNARVDSVTFGMGMGPQDDEPTHVTFVIRGEYDRMGTLIALEDMLLEQQADMPPDFKSDISAFSINDIEVLRSQGPWQDVAILMPSNELMIVTTGPGARRNDGASTLPLDTLAERYQMEEPELAFSETLMTEIGKIDREVAGAWAAIEVVAVIRDEMDEVAGPYTAAHAFGVMDEETGQIDIAWAAVGEDADEVAENVAMINEELAEGMEELQEEVDEAEGFEKQMYGMMLQIMGTIFFEAEEGQMNGGMTLPPGGPGELMMFPLFFMMGGVQPAPADQAQFAEAQAEEVVEARDVAVDPEPVGAE